MPATWEKVDKFTNKAIAAACVALALFYLYTGFFGFADRLSQMGPILMLGMFVAFVKKPLSRANPRGWTRFLDYGFALASVGIIARMIYQQKDPLVFVLPPAGVNLFLMWFLVALVLEATRRIVGMAFPALAIIAIIYGVFGHLLAPPFYHAFLKLDRLAFAATYGELGIFGLPLNTISSVVIFFIIFSAFLNGTGGGNAFVDLGFAFFGRFRGGPAKAAVMSSAMFGTISGSGVANVLATGTFTIPLMKKTGYSSTMAGAVEAVASTGGSLVPPIMGTTAFIMADYIGVPYREVAIAAALPALLYYLALFTAVDLEAAKLGLKGLGQEDRPSVRKAVFSAWPVFIVLAVLMYFLFVAMVTPVRSVLNALIALVLVSLLTKAGRKGLRHIWDLLKNGASDMTLLSLACATAGILISMLNITNLGVQLSGILVDWSRGIPLLLLILTMVAALILGMGINATAVYLTLVVVLVPALRQMGFPTLSANLFILYFGILCSITPPVALAAYAASGLSGADPMKTGLKATQLGLIAFIVPYFFMYSPALLLQGDAATVVVSAITAIIGTVGFAGMLQGRLIGQADIVQRILLGGGGLLMIYPNMVTSTVGLALLAVVLLWQLGQRRRRVALANGQDPTGSFR